MSKTGRVDVWRMNLDGDALTEARIETWRGTLSGEELRRADAFRTVEHRRDYVAAHGALRWVLARELSIGPAEVDFAAGSMGNRAGERTKPRLNREAGVELTDLRFNLSHTAGAVLIAVGIGREMGIDIELRRPMEDLESMARSVMSTEELAQWMELSNEESFGEGRIWSERLRAFYNVWTRKESYLKAIGLGLYRGLQEVTVPVSAERLHEGESQAKEVSGNNRAWRRVIDSVGDRDWIVGDIPAGEDYSASVCCEGLEAPDVRLRTVELS